MGDKTLIFHFSIPNIPFFYLAFRAWSHWRALSGSRHIEFLLEKKLITPQPSNILDELYSAGKKPFNTSASLPTTSSTPEDSTAPEETIILHKSDGKRIAEALKIPELNVELDRAVWQVKKALEAKKELKEEKVELDRAKRESEEKQ